jgi:hypothetical protein
MKSLDAIVAANRSVEPGYSGPAESYIDRQARGKYARNNVRMQLAELRHVTQLSRNGLHTPICTYCGADAKQATMCNDPLCTMSYTAQEDKT